MNYSQTLFIGHERALETCEFNNMSSTPTIGARHLSKSTSELSSPREMPEIRPRSAAPPEVSHLSVYQKAHSFFAQLKSRWGHSKRERRHKSPGRQDSTDYAADLSSDHSTPSTQSPRHRLHARTDSPLSRACPGGGDTSSPSGSPKPRVPTSSAVAGLDLLPLGSNDEITRRREAVLRQHSFFQLRIHLRRGNGLVAMDKNGLSDPYVKFKVGGRLIYKSRTVYRDLNPTWDESFTVPIEDPFIPIQIKVFDYDWGLQDDFMGSATLDLTTLDLGRATEVTMVLQDPDRPDTTLGEILLTATLYPKSQEDKEQYYQKNSRVADVNKRLKSQIWSSVVTIALVEGKNLLACDPETGTSDPYVKFRLGNEKYKSRIVWRSLNPRWLEQFDLHLYDDGDQQLEITVWDKDRSRDDFIGRCVIDLTTLERERTHSLWQQLEDGAGSLHLLLTISGTTASETISDLTTYEENPREVENIMNRYIWHRTFHNIKDVGHLTVKVYRASGLAAADLGGKSDPFCVLELGNARLQTQTEYKTLSPSWQKIFTFNVKDINNVLDITVFDEDRDHKVEFLGRVLIPLLRIRNGEKRWYALKDRKLRSRAKGNNPQILLEMNLAWNPIRACIRTLNPKEEKYMQSEVKFKRQVFVRNVLRLKVFIMYFYEFGKIFQNCFEWESKVQSFAALLLFLVLCYYFEPWMLPIAGLLIFLKQYVVRILAGPSLIPWDETADSDIEDDEDDDKEKEEKKSLKERLQAIQEVTQGVQNAIGRIASLLEGVKNTFNFTVPYLSWIAIGLLVAATIVLYLIPIRYLLMLWGTNKFFRRILRPHSVPNNEVLDLLSRVPDDEMLVTGGNKGIGYAIVKGLCEKFQGIVYLTARDVGRGEAAVSKLKELGFNPLFHQLDINDQGSITKFKNHLVEKHGGLDLLVNNAAIAYKNDAPDPFSEQAKTTVAVNYFSLLRVCETLFPILRQNARVVNLSSSAGHLSRIPSPDLRAKFSDPNLTVPQLNKLMDQFVQDAKANKHQEAGWGTSAYVVSKVGVSALTRIQQREFDKEAPNRNISVNSVHPGYVDTDMTSHKGPWTIEQGARAPLFLALEAENLKGQYIWSNATVVQWDADKPPAPV